MGGATRKSMSATHIGSGSAAYGAVVRNCRACAHFSELVGPTTVENFVKIVHF